MALETLKDVSEIGGFDVVVMDELREKYPERFTESGQMDWKWFETEVRPNKFIYVRHDKNSISFTIQNGPIKENGVNGCQVLTLIQTAEKIIEELDNKFPCRENSKTLLHLRQAIEAQEERTANREKRGVEGKNLL